MVFVEVESACKHVEPYESENINKNDNRYKIVPNFGQTIEHDVDNIPGLS
jgi:hypothetical protein